MSKIRISGSQYFLLIISYILCNDMIRGIYNPKLMNDAWIPALGGTFGSILLFYFYSFLFKNNHYQDLALTMEQLLGKVLARILFVLYALYFLVMTFLTVRDIAELLEVFVGTNYPHFIIGGVILIACLYAINHGIENIARSNSFITICFIGFLLFFISLIYLLYSADTTNFLPILENGITPVIIPTLEMSYSVPFGELFAVLLLFGFVKDGKKSFKFGLLGILAAGLILSLITVTNIIIIGPNGMIHDLYTMLLIARGVEYKKYIQRMDIFLLSLTTIIVVMKCVILLYSTKHLLIRVIPIKKEIWISIVTVGSLIITLYFVGLNFIELIAFRRTVVIPYLGLAFDVIIPVILIILSFIHRILKPAKQMEQKEHDQVINEMAS